MNWFLIALINPIAHAFINHFDKYLISKFIKGGAVGALILFSSLFAVVLLPILFVINPEILTGITTFRAAVLMVNGTFLTIAILLYLYAIESEEASIVAPLFQLIPVFGFIFGYFILGETISGNEMWAAALIVIGGIILSLELAGRGTRFKWKLALLMLGSSIFYAVNAVIFKSIAVEQGFVDALFWDMLGKVLLGIVLFLAVRSYREQFINLLKSNKYTIIGLNVVNEIIGLAGEIALILAVMFAPVVLVQSVGGLQPMFVFLFAVLFTVFLPKFAQESFTKKDIAQKVIGIVIITAGVYLLDLG